MWPKYIDHNKSCNSTEPIKSKISVSENTSIDNELLITTYCDSEKPSVLIIEEDTEIRHLLSALLKNKYQVISTGSLNHGQSITQEMNIDLVLCDVVLPDGNGYEITHILKNNGNTAHIPIILLTAVADVVMHQEGWNNGADDYIVKPFRTDHLLQRISALIENRQRLKTYYLERAQDKE